MSMSSGGRVLLMWLSVFITTGCRSYTTADAVPVVEGDVISELGLSGTSTEAFHAILISRLMEEAELEDFKPHVHGSLSRHYDVGVGRHEEGSVAAARRAREISGPRPEARAGIFKVEFSGIFIFNSEGNITLAADYEDPPDEQSGFMFVHVVDPQGDDRSYTLYVLFEADRDRWVMEELGHDRVPKVRRSTR